MFGFLDKALAILVAVLALALALLTAYGWLFYGPARYRAGAKAEQARWVAVIETKNTEIAVANAAAEQSREQLAASNQAAIAAAAKVEIPALPRSTTQPCDLPQGVRLELNRIR